MKKILITQRVDLITDRNEIRDGLDLKLSEILYSLNLLPIPISNCIGNLTEENIKKVIQILNPDGIILSGGNDLEEYKNRDYLEKKIIEYAIKERKPMLGICRGMQMICCAFGANIEPISNHVNTTRKVTGKIQKHIKCFHNNKITFCPEEIEILSKAKDGCIEAIQVKKYPIIGIMWHPERDDKIDSIDRKIFIDLFK